VTAYEELTALNEDDAFAAKDALSTVIEDVCEFKTKEVEFKPSNKSAFKAYDEEAIVKLKVLLSPLVKVKILLLIEAVVNESADEPVADTIKLKVVLSPLVKVKVLPLTDPVDT
jgi:hypothetical protein